MLILREALINKRRLARTAGDRSSAGDRSDSPVVSAVPLPVVGMQPVGEIVAQAGRADVVHDTGESVHANCAGDVVGHIELQRVVDPSADLAAVGSVALDREKQQVRGLE